MNIKKHLFQISLLLISVFLFSCDDELDSGNENPTFSYVVSYEFLETITKEDVNTRFNSDPLISGFITNDVEAYKVTYNTTNYDNTMVEASGLVLVPQVTGKVKLMSFQHSTLAKDNNPAIDQEHRAPSYLSPESAEISLSAVLFASSGFYVSAADYIGYGTTKDLIHPYEHAETTATASYDMLEAANELREFLEVEAVSGTYLIGYSQGGNSTMALHKYMEDNGLTDKFPIKKSAMGAGAYNKTAVGDFIFNNQEPLGFSLSLYLWVMDTYDKVYPSLEKGLAYYLNEPYATEVINGGYFALSNTNPQEVFTDAFIADINNPQSAFSQALADNDIYDWKALAPIKLYHSQNDGLVPYFNSADAFEAMNAKGSTDVTFETFTFGESVPVESIHGAGGARFFTEVVAYYFR
ncbi:MAG: putative esterase [Marivirga sp.]|jgi:predicted esterase